MSCRSEGARPPSFRALHSSLKGDLLPHRLRALGGSFEHASISRAGQAFEWPEADVPARFAHGSLDAGIAHGHRDWMSALGARGSFFLSKHLDCLPGEQTDLYPREPGECTL